MDQNTKFKSDSRGLDSPSQIYMNHEFSNVNSTDPSKINSLDRNLIDAFNFTESVLKPKSTVKNQFFPCKTVKEETSSTDSSASKLNSSDSGTSSEESQEDQILKDNNPKIDKELSNISSTQKSDSQPINSVSESILREFFENKDGKLKLDFSKIFELFQKWMGILLEQENLLKYKADYIINWMHNFALLKSSMSEINEKIENYNNKLAIFDDTADAIDEEYHTYSKLLQTADNILSNNADIEFYNQNNESRIQLYSSVNKFESDMKSIMHKMDKLDSPFRKFNLPDSQTYLEMTETLANFEIITNLIKELIDLSL